LLLPLDHFLHFSNTLIIFKTIFGFHFLILDSKRGHFSHLQGRSRSSSQSTPGKTGFAIKRSDNAPVTLQGWLYKQGSDGLMLWKKRWFVLSEFCLFYYKGKANFQLEEKNTHNPSSFIFVLSFCFCKGVKLSNEMCVG